MDKTKLLWDNISYLIEKNKHGKSGFSETKLCKSIGIHQQSFNMSKKNKSDLKFSIAVKIADYFNKSYCPCGEE